MILLEFKINIRNVTNANEYINTIISNVNERKPSDVYIFYIPVMDEPTGIKCIYPTYLILDKTTCDFKMFEDGLKEQDNKFKAYVEQIKSGFKL